MLVVAAVAVATTMVIQVQGQVDWEVVAQVVLQVLVSLLVTQAPQTPVAVAVVLDKAVLELNSVEPVDLE